MSEDRGPGFMARCWRSFREKVIPPDAPDIQRLEMERAFYAGALVVFEFLEVISLPDVSEEVGVEQLGAARRETRGFIAGQLSRDGGGR